MVGSLCSAIKGNTISCLLKYHSEVPLIHIMAKVEKPDNTKNGEAVEPREL